MKVTYKVSTRDGNIIKGDLEARDIKEAVYFLRNKDFIPIEVREKEEKNIASLSSFFRKEKSSDVILFTRQLSSMMTSGLTLMQSLAILKDQLQNAAMRDIVNGIIIEVQAGKTFASAISKYPKVFSPIYISLVRAAESSGFLEKILQRLAANLEKEQKLRITIRSALLYPTIILVLMVVVVFLMMIFVIPQLKSLYESLNIPLPITTRIILGLSNFTVTFWPVMIAGILLFGVLYRRVTRSESGRKLIDRLILRVPIFGKLVSETILAEFSRTFGLLIAAGTLVVASLEQTAEVANNGLYKAAILDVARNIEKGITIGDAMKNHDIFPSVLVEMVKVGEQTGKLDESLLKASEYFEREVDVTVKTLTTALEPVIMIILGVGVAFLIISILTPIYNLTTSIR